VNLEEWQEGFIVGAKSIFAAWSSIQLVVSADMGGKGTLQVIKDILYDTVAIYFEHEQVKVKDVAGFLEECLENDFHFEVHDGTTFKVALLLSKLFNQCSKGNYTLLNDILLKNYKDEPQDLVFGGMKYHQFPQVIELHIQVQVEEISVVMSTISIEPEKEEIDNDGWITVKSRKKRLKMNKEYFEEVQLKGNSFYQNFCNLLIPERSRSLLTSIKMKNDCQFCK